MPSDPISVLAAELRRAIGPQAVVSAPDALRTYDADASMIVAHAPQLVALPADGAQAATVVRLAARHGLPVVARGAGTGIAGGAIALRGGVMLSTSRMDRVLELDVRNRRASVQPGVVNADLNARLAPLGYQFAPDPSSQRASTIGGNFGTNAGGPHCLKYGVTSNHILAIELATADGQLIWTGDGIADAAGYDLTGLIVGSEGTFGVATRVVVRLTPLPEANRVVLALFPSVGAASSAVSRVIAAGSLPTSLEVMDHNALRAVNSAYGLGLPEAVGTTLLIIEVDGVEDGLDDLLGEILERCREAGAFELRPARSPTEQARVWAARKSVAGAIGRLAPAYYLIDTVVPRTRLPLMMEHIERLHQQYALEICNVFHAGDGNLHPLVLYDPRDPDQVRRAHAIARSVLDLSIAQGGVISGEHGIGVEKQDYLPLLFSPAELQLQATVYHVFNPADHLNPAKIFPAATRPGDLAAARAARLGVRERRQGDKETRRQGDKETANVIENSDTSEVAWRDSLSHSLLVSLSEAVGADHLLTGADVAAYAVHGHLPTAVALPGSVAELAGVVAACHRAGAALVPWGGGTRQTSGRPLDLEAGRPLVVVGTRRLNRVRLYEPDDLTIGVEAGVSLAALQAELARHGQILPLDIAAPAQATIGGLVATATAGPRRLGYGTMRDWVLALTVVEPDGTLVRLGAQVVKNVTGYDLVKLYVGSQGSLGIIAEVSLKVFPRPRATASFVASFATPAPALALLDELAASRLLPAAVVYLEGWADHGRRRTADEEPPTDHPSSFVLVVRAEGHPAAVARHLRELEELAIRHAAAARTLDAGTAATLWEAVAAHEDARAAPGAALLRLCVLPSDLGVARAHVAALARQHNLALTLSAHALSGVLTLRASGPLEGLRALHAALLARWRHAQLLAADPAIAADASAWGAQPVADALMRRIKRAIDPHELLNPGRFVV